MIDVNEDKDQFEIQFKDTKFAEKNETLEARADRRRVLAKEASQKEAQFGGMGGGATTPPTATSHQPGQISFVSAR